ncbi:hypothetical protein AMELA_G00056970 [Ameiurus melas]|uniref:Uncharacterized protein n=1 Tax=Ameiurus melas TaxID=219545 RepID=A0A7J6B0K1_AMEME|nr:hypothetical protein AMELA_G00056970 [Ameiurus melas]
MLKRGTGFYSALFTPRTSAAVTELIFASPHNELQQARLKLSRLIHNWFFLKFLRFPGGTSPRTIPAPECSC